MGACLRQSKEALFMVLQVKVRDGEDGRYYTLVVCRPPAQWPVTSDQYPAGVLFCDRSTPEDGPPSNRMNEVKRSAGGATDS